jgi:hypothetical protein
LKTVLFTYYSSQVQEIFLDNVESLIKNSSSVYSEIVICSQIEVPLKIVKALSKYSQVNRVFPDYNSQKVKRASAPNLRYQVDPFILTALSYKDHIVTVFDPQLFIINPILEYSGNNIFYRNHNGTVSSKLFTIVNTDPTRNVLVNSLLDCDFTDRSTNAKFTFVIVNAAPFSTSVIYDKQFIFSSPSENDELIENRIIALDLSDTVTSSQIHKKIWATRKTHVPKASVLSKITTAVIESVSTLISPEPEPINLDASFELDQNSSLVDLSIESALMYFDRIYVINLQHRLDRLTEFKKQLASAGLSQFFINHKIEVFSAINIPNKGYEGCKLSHYSIVKSAKAQGLSRILVFEDDASFIGSIENLVKSISQLKKIKWDIFYLGCNPLDPLNQLDYNLAKVKNAYTTHSIAYNSSFYDHFIKSVDLKEFEILDEWLATHAQYKFSCVASYPLQFTQTAGFSNIERREVNYQNIAENFNRSTNHFITNQSMSSTKPSYYKLHTDYENESNKHSASVGFLIVATGKYDIFVNPLIESIEKYVLPNNSKHYHIFTEKPSLVLSVNNYSIHKIDHKPFPYPTLHRFHFFSKYAKSLTQDYLAYIDADTLITSQIGTEILTPRTVTQHCGYLNVIGTFEDRPESAVYVDSTIARNYYGGGFYCLAKDSFFNMMDWCKDAIDYEERNARIPVWHDESAINKYFTLVEPTRVLSPSYHYPENNPRIYASWEGQDFPCKILLLDKNHKEIRS